MKKSFVTRLLSISLAATMALSQGMTSYAANTSDDTSVVAGTLTSTVEEDAASKESSDDSGEDKSDAPGTGSDLEDETETDDNKKNNNESATDASNDASSDEESVTDSSSDASSDEESASDASSEASSDDAADASSDASSEASSDEDKELPDGINPLPKGYKLSSTEEKMKDELEENGVFDQFKSMTEGVDYAENEIVTLAADEDMARLIAETYSGELKDFSYGVATISLSGSELSVGEAFEYSLDDDLDLPLVEPNYYSDFIEPDNGADAEVYAAPYVHSGNYFSERWWNDGYRDPFLNPENANYQWHHSMINTYAAWGVTTGNSNVTVAVIDSGVSAGHKDLGAPIEAIGVSGNGAADQNGHGTHVAGIIAGRLNGALGAGVAPGVKLLTIRASDAGNSGSFSSANIFRALAQAGGLQVVGLKDDKYGTFTSVNIISNGRKADIVNMSLGGALYSPYYERIMDAMYQAGVTVVVAMGNDSSNQKCYPAAFKHVISVAAVSESGDRSFYSNYGAWADIAAPGSRIYSADKNNANGYVYMDGTSMACPVVAGACALYMSAVGHVDPDTMERVIKSSVSGNAGAGTGAGILDLSKMFKGDVTAPLVSLFSADNDSALVGEVQDGNTFTVPETATVGPSAVLKFTPLNFDANGRPVNEIRGKVTAGNKGTSIVYTVNGTTPSVNNGTVVNGTVSNGTVKVSDIINKSSNAKQKITVKAMAVTGMGVAGKVSTLTFTVDPVQKSFAALGTVNVKITNAPQRLVAGKSLKLEAVVTDSKNPAVSQNVTWRIESYTGGDMSKAKINAANGTLSTDASQTGKLVISCTSADSRQIAKVTISVEKDLLIKTMAVENGKNVDMKLGQSRNIKLTSLVNTGNSNILSSTTKQFQWTTSNSSVVKISDSKTNTVAATAVSAGTATITCKALDGSGKSAKVTVKVISDKKTSGLSVTSGGSALTTLTTYIGAGAKTVSVKYVNNTPAVAPLWSTSNAKVVTITPNGNSATITPVAKGTANITCLAPDGSGKKAIVKVTVVQRVEKITLSGQLFTAPGGSAKLAATVLPVEANDKKVNWTVSGASGVTIANGLVKVDKNVKEGTVLTVTAKAADGSGVQSSAKVTVCAKATSVSVKNTKTNKETNAETLATVKKGKYEQDLYLSAQTNTGKDVSFTSSNTNVATVSVTSGKSVTVKAVGKGTAVITAAAQDGSGKKATVKVTVIQPATAIEVTGQSAIARGASATFKANVLPATANNKNVTWSIPGAPAGVTISNGTVKVAKDVPVGRAIKVVANHNDNGNVISKEFTFKVIQAKAAVVKVMPKPQSVNQDVNIPTYTGNSLSSIRLYSVNVPDSDKITENTVILEKTEILGAAKENLKSNVSVKWASSNTNVATVSSENGDSVTVEAHQPGTANITCTAQDGSGKKATVKVTVITPSSHIELSTGSDVISFNEGNTVYSAISMGKATTIKAVMGQAYGKATNAGIAWDYEIGFYNGSFTKVPDKYKATYQKNKDMFSFANGKVTASATSAMQKAASKYAGTIGKSLSNAGNPAIRVIARSTDGTGNEDSMVIVAVRPTTQVNLYFPNGRKVMPNYIAIADLSHPDGNGLYIVSDGTIKDFNVVSSNPDIASGYVSYGSGDSNGALLIFPHSKGTVTFTVNALDGSGKKATVKVQVR
ncbi:S8 family serine peptidase [Butyrivibrio proteoclasticus]|uniref:S8 family serine peptidase n=1 Tax=Butyrivibrio proteoclasticus TaxID=43305 RepID=UPI00047EE176|nr:S8 family serine peptidase [Butyrivibrio proteoclasticus]